MQQQLLSSSSVSSSTATSSSLTSTKCGLSCCGNDCKCQICFCRETAQVSNVSEPRLAVDLLVCLQTILPPPSSTTAALDEVAGYRQTLFETLIRKCKRSILLRVNCIRKVSELGRSSFDEAFVLLRCFTDVPSEGVKDGQLRSLHALLLAALHGIVGASRVEVLDTARRVQLLDQIQSEQTISLSLRKRHDTSVDALDGLVESELVVTGMKCASCVNTLESIIRQLPGVQSASVSLLTQTVTVSHSEHDTPIIALKKAIEDVGFEVVGSKRISDSSNHGQKERQLVTVELSIDGMTCSSCSAGIESALKNKEGVFSVSVGVLTKSGSFVIDPEILGVRDLMAFIQNMGYEVSLPASDATALKSGEGDLESRAALRRFLLSLVFAVPTFLIAMVFEMFLPPANPVHHFFMSQLIPGLALSHFILFLFASVVQFYLALTFYKSAYQVLRYTGTPNMEVLVVLGTSAAYGISILSMILNIAARQVQHMTFFETSVLLITLIYLGRYFEAMAKKMTIETMTNLLSRAADGDVCLVQLSLGDEWQIVSETNLKLDLVQVGDILKINPLENIPVDGVIIRGETSVDESMLTGESMPVSKQVGSQIYAGTINLSSLCYVKALSVGSNTVLQKIVKLVTQAQSKKPKVQEVADWIARYFVSVIVVLAVLDFLVWLLVGMLGFVPEYLVPEGFNSFLMALFFGVSILVIACPCSLGLATPTAVMVGTGLAAKYGILVKEGGVALEKGAALNAVVFDKTGTLTLGKPLVKNVHMIPVADNVDLLWRMVLKAACHSEHPLSKSLCSYIKNDLNSDPAPSEIERVSEVPGSGVFAKFQDGQEIFIGNERWITSKLSSPLPIELVDRLETWKQNGETIVLVAKSSLSTVKVRCAISFADQPRPEASHVIAELHRMGISTWMLSGDNLTVAQAVGKMVGIPAENVYANVMPNEKADRIRVIQRTAKWTSASKRYGFGLFQKRRKVGDCEFGERRESHSWVIQDHAMVAMVGDGSNDSIALAQADVGVAIGTGTDLALQSASVLLLTPNLHALLSFLYISTTTVRRIYINFFWAGIYNVVAIPVAGGLFYPWMRVRLDPTLAGLAMAFSSVSVVLSSLALRYTVDRHMRKR